MTEATYELCLKDTAGYKAFIESELKRLPQFTKNDMESPTQYCQRLNHELRKKAIYAANPGLREKEEEKTRLFHIKAKLKSIGENASRMAVERSRIKVTLPLCSKFPEQGSVTFTSNERDIDSYDGLFSFAFYAHNVKDFGVYARNSVKASKYGRGLKAYCEFINTNPFFEKWAIIIYVDEWTYEVLNFLKLYPKVIIAIVKWNQFTVTADKKPNKIEGTVFRTLRFQALEAFPRSTICVRDADTIFNTGDVTEKDTENIGNWEKQFIEMWYTEGSPILLGVFLNYLKMWHTDFPFIFPLKNVDLLEKKRFNSKTSNSQLYFRSPAGVLAGFTNFTNKRPTDIWVYSFDYIALHYKLYNSPFGKQISNQRFWILNVGKDERILIFIMLVKYWNITYFLPIAYGDKGDDLFDSNYLPAAFEKKISLNNTTSYESEMKFSVPKSNFLLKENNVGKNVDQLYKEHFHEFADHYLVWLNKIMSKSEEEVAQNFRSIMNKSPPLKSNNFYENPHRIPQSTLPPLVAATSISGGGRKRNLTRNRKHKNKNKKSRKYTRRN